MRWPLARAQGDRGGDELHQRVIGIEPARRAVPRGRQQLRRIGGQIARKERDRAAVRQPAPQRRKLLALVADHVLGGGAQARKRERKRLCPGKIGAVLRLAQKRAGDRGQPRVLRMVQMVGLGRGKENALDPPRAKERGQHPGLAGAEGGKDPRHRSPQILERRGPGMDRAEHVDQHHLPVDAGEMLAEEGLDHLVLVGLEAARHLAAKRAAGIVARRHRREGERGGTRHLAGQQEAPGRTVGKARRARRVQMRGEGRGERPRRGFGKGGGKIGRRQRGEEGAAFGPPGQARQHRRRPLRERAVQQAEVEKPLARIVDDVEMHGAQPAQPAQKSRGGHAKAQPQLGDGARALGPVRRGTGQRGKVALVIEARHGVVGLRLQEGRADIRTPGQRRHPAAVKQVRDERGDEHRLARP
ncbi:hypothetical protein SDC9_13069 [bioreactor metagenome]|uniref:Uncharacterized protein n=1 Tax=bioreactor metagenome TaxID=1076179 RepID=A0A644TK99_9ZZZZ